MLEKETQKHIRLDNLLRMFSESSFIESSIFDLESGFSIVESGFLKRESEHKSGFFSSPDFLRVRVQVRVRVRSGFRSMPMVKDLMWSNFTHVLVPARTACYIGCIFCVERHLLSTIYFHYIVVAISELFRRY